MMIRAISREEEMEIPEFKNHDEAMKWFESRYGERFEVVDVDIMDEEKIFFCHLILDEEKYRAGKAFMNEGNIMTGVSAMDFIRAYQNIEITQSGQIHIDH